ncbi:hypothetical protein [Hydrogenophaga laconesensis]|uniref:Histidine kinase-, DNA gyrase B-, and HSP90-like ATPase n=1 Tax=Hydrogenophaga laconesensis TaxID=1805971 RepID=A0ABU1VCF2_9BURK|nr:hypothetical protein [Hydrogenophaga laconesensis]MDR7095149.1 hypothetical protein [Hydrogenophaga laconesensis]
MTLDIRGSLKSTKLSRNPYVVFEELISNAIDSFLIRKNSDASAKNLHIDIAVEFFSTNLIGDLDDMSISCGDNGCGLGDDQLEAFLTKDTSYKDDLPIPGIGKCMGAGRIQFFHHFSTLTLDSTYRTGDGFFRRQVSYSEPTKQITPQDFSSIPGAASNLGTEVFLKNLRAPVRDRILRKTSPVDLYSAPTLKQQMLLTFLQRLVGLGDQIGDFEINFVTRQRKNGDLVKSSERSDSLKRADLPNVTRQQMVSVEECDPATGERLGTHQSFNLSHYQLDATKYNLPNNAVAFCAKSSPVKDVTSKYFRTRAEQINPVGGFYHFVLIESEYLDVRVNEQRDDFNGIPDDIPSGDLFSTEKISYAAIHEAIDPVIVEMVDPSNWSRDAVLHNIVNQFGISEAMLQDTSTRIRYGETAQVVAERVLKKYQEQVIDETSAIFELKEEIKKTEPDTEEFREKINELAWKYTSSLKKFDMANLSQLVVRRAAIVEVLDLACGKNLAMQAIKEGVRRKDERIIHSIFFPMRKDSDEVSDHDMWLLSEEYHYYNYIASDVPLADISWSGGGKVFDGDIDVEFQKLLSKRVEDNKAKRPDIALFNSEGSAVIVEFKAPGVNVDEHIGDLSEYAYLLASKSGGKIRKIYGYLIGDTVNPLRLSGWTPFSQGKGWFYSNPLIDPYSRQPLGETYFEILHFDDVIERAKKRIRIYQGKINLDLT